MNNAELSLDPATRYRIEVAGRVDVDWLRDFDRITEVTIDGLIQTEEIAVLYLRTDPSRILGLAQRLRRLGMAILQIQIASEAR